MTAQCANPLDLCMTRIRAGEFEMGACDVDREAFPDERPRHRVRLTQDYLLGSIPVTQDQFSALLPLPAQTYVGEEFPLLECSWFDAVAYCNALSEASDLPKYYGISDASVDVLGGDGYRLPTEAEWEYACRAGTTHPHFWESDSDKVSDYVVCVELGFGGYLAMLLYWVSGLHFYDSSKNCPMPCGSKKPNPWGLFDMLGNVSEWCQDWYDLYSDAPTIDPSGPTEGDFKVLRGGGYLELACYMRSSNRMFSEPDLAMGGFRVARTVLED